MGSFNITVFELNPDKPLSSDGLSLPITRQISYESFLFIQSAVRTAYWEQKEERSFFLSKVDRKRRSKTGSARFVVTEESLSLT